MICHEIAMIVDILDNFPQERKQKFSHLAFAINKLSQDVVTDENIVGASQSIDDFSENFVELYGPEMQTYDFL